MGWTMMEQILLVALIIGFFQVSKVRCVSQPTGFQRGSVESIPSSDELRSGDDLFYNKDDDEIPLFQRGSVEAVFRENEGYPISEYYGAAKGVQNGDRSAVILPYYGAARSKGAREISPAFPFFRSAVESLPYGKIGDSRAYLRNELLDGKKFHPEARNYGQTSNFNAPTGEEERKILSRSEDLVFSRKGDSRLENDESYNYKVVCYYGGWAVYRPEPMNFGIKDIDPYACTHLIYSFAGLRDNKIVSLDEDEDIVKGSYKAAVALKKKNSNLKVMIAIGGWNEGGKRYSEMASSKSSRQIFVDSVLEFLDRYGFDGIDLDWEYPGATDRGGRYSDKNNFASLVEELSSRLKPQGLLLSAAVSAAKFRVNEGYDVPRISKGLDFINVMTYDLHGSWDRFADHHSPLFGRSHDQWAHKTLNSDFAMSYWAEKGAPKRKLVLGTPFYGRSFTLRNPKKIKPGSPTKEGGKPGKFTNETGFLAYYEICLNNKNEEWIRDQDSDGNVFVYKGDQWVGYDTLESVERKMNFVKSEEYGGAMIWAIDLDDFTGICGKSWPLLSSINRVLRPKGTAQEEIVQKPPTTEGSLLIASSTTSTTTIESTVTSTTTSKSTTTSLIEKGDYACESPGIFASPKRCDEFVICDASKKAYVNRCQEGLAFDSNLKICNWPEKVKCLGNDVQVYRQNICSILSDGLYSDPADCSQMFYCQEGYQKGFSCPYGHYFDVIYGVCRLQLFKNQCHLGIVTRVAINTANYNDLKPLPSVKTSPSSKKVICYYTNWGILRKSDGKYVPEHINASLCSHVIYAYANLDSESLNLIPSNKLFDIKNDGYRRARKAVKLTNPDAKILLAVGGWLESSGNKYSRMVNNQTSRGKFISSVLEHLEKYEYDGVSIEWFYPVCWQSDCSKGPAKDKSGFSSLLKDLRSRGEKYILAAAISGYKSVLDVAYDFPLLDKYLDIINVKTYDYHGFWDGKTGHHSSFMNSASIMRYISSMGVSKEKLNLGVTSYGQSFTLKDPSNTAIGSSTRGPGVAGKYTKQRGMMAYYEICSKIKTNEFNEENGDSPYAYDSSNWIGYDTIDSLKTKMEFIINEGFGGAAMWTIDLDDFNNICCQGQYPLLRAVNEALMRKNLSVTNDCRRPNPPVTPKPVRLETTTGYDDGSSSSNRYTTPEMKPFMTSSNPITDTLQIINEESTIEIPSGVECHKNGEYLPHPTDCQKFYRCVNDKKKLQSCASGLRWDKDAHRCDWPSNVKCETFEEEETLEGSGEGTNDDVCIHGAYEPVSGDCSAYSLCINGKMIRRTCSSGLHWHQSKTNCDWPDKKNCHEPGYKIVSCDLTSEEYVSDPEGDCAKFYRCVHGEYLEQNCRHGTHWNNEVKVCDFPENSGCKTESNSTSESTTISSIISSSLPSMPQVNPTTSVPIKLKPVPLSGPLKGDYKVVCYFTNWAWYRPGIGKYRPEDIDPSICTHIVYGFAVLDYSNLIIKPHDSWADIDNDFYGKVVKLKEKGIRVTIAIGGWNDSAGDKYSRLVNNPTSRQRFIKHVVEFIKKYKFDGLDLDWEYPKCWQVDCSKGPESDKEAFATFVKELREAFNPYGFLLSAAVSPAKKVVDAGYNVPVIAQNLDWIAVMTYDYHGHWDKKTGHVAPIYRHPDDINVHFNMDFSIKYWIKNGAPKEKIILGMPLYGQSFTLKDASNTGLNSPANKGQAGKFTRAAGFLAYYEICHKIQKEGWTKIENEKGLMGPYAFKGSQWVSFDDQKSIQYKSEYIRHHGLGGGMVWALDLDDFNNRCGQGNHPLMNTIKSILGPGKNESYSFINDFTKTNITQDSNVNSTIEHKETEKIVQTEETKISSSKNIKKKVVCYFTNWAWYRPGDGKFQPENIDSSLCTHIVYGFAVLNGETLTLKPHDSWADLDNGFYEKVTNLKTKDKFVLLAIGGWNDSAGDKYSRLVSDPEARRRFVTHVVDFIEKHGFDGLDLDWEYPKCWQVDCKKGPKSDKSNFADWVEELSLAFKEKDLLLTAAVSPSRDVVNEGYDVKRLNEHLDYVSVMAYDYHGQWDKKTGHISPLYHHPESDKEHFNVDFSVNHWLKSGLDKQKLIMGLPLYGQSFTLASRSENGLNAKSYGGGEAGEFTRSRGFLSFFEICDRIKNEGWTVVKDAQNRIGPYAYKGDQWVGFDDPATIRLKTKYINEKDLGGAMIWALDLDDFGDFCKCGESYPLLKTINRVLGRLDNNNTNSNESCFDKNHSSSTAIPSEVSVTMNLAEDDCTPGEFSSHPSDCNKFFQCSQSKKLEERLCPQGTHWNSDKKFCDWPRNVDCSSSSSTQSSIKVDFESENNEIGEQKKEEEEEEIEEVTAIDESPSILQGSDKKKIVCYFTNWAWYRKGKGKYVPEDIDPTLCTHINYGFAVLDPSELTIRAHDSWADYDNKFYKRVAAYKDKGIKVLLALGGWNDSEGDKYSRLVNSPTSRKKFVKQAIKFIEKNGFEGLDLDWEYPKCWQVDCSRGPDSDKANFAELLRELRAAFDPKGWLLTAAVSPSKRVIDEGYDVKALNKYLDHINVMTYDYHGHWDKKTGHVAPLYDYPGSTKYFNANFSMNYWVEKGADRKKLIMGMPLYGQSFTLDDPKNEHGLNAPARNKGKAGPYTRSAGFLAYYEICSVLKTQTWTVVHSKAMGPYAYSGDQWVGFDDVQTIEKKSKYVMDNDFGGGMIWALDLDDFNDVCGCGKYPLLKTMNSVIRGDSESVVKCDPFNRLDQYVLYQPVEYVVPTIQHVLYRLFKK